MSVVWAAYHKNAREEKYLNSAGIKVIRKLSDDSKRTSDYLRNRESVIDFL